MSNYFYTDSSKHQNQHQGHGAVRNFVDTQHRSKFSYPVNIVIQSYNGMFFYIRDKKKTQECVL